MAFSEILMNWAANLSHTHCCHVRGLVQWCWGSHPTAVAAEARQTHPHSPSRFGVMLLSWCPPWPRTAPTTCFAFYFAPISPCHMNNLVQFFLRLNFLLILHLCAVIVALVSDPSQAVLLTLSLTPLSGCFLLFAQPLDRAGPSLAWQSPLHSTSAQNQTPPCNFVINAGIFLHFSHCHLIQHQNLLSTQAGVSLHWLSHTHYPTCQ